MSLCVCVCILSNPKQSKKYAQEIVISLSLVTAYVVPGCVGRRRSALARLTLGIYIITGPRACSHSICKTGFSLNQLNAPLNCLNIYTRIITYICTYCKTCSICVYTIIHFTAFIVVTSILGACSR